MKNIINLMRIKQWFKNVIVFAPLFADVSYITLSNFVYLLSAFFCLSISSSLIYVLNDLCDCEKDEQHYYKKNRPIASGCVSLKRAVSLVFCLLLILGVSLYFIADYTITCICIVYILLNLAYSYKLKNIVYVDVFVIAFGFLLRVLIPYVGLSFPISYNLLLSVFTFSSAFGFLKRKFELLNDERKCRSVLKFYRFEILNFLIILMLSLTVLFYLLWMFNDTTFPNFTYVTVIILIFAFYKVFNLLNKKYHSDPFEMITREKGFWITIFIALIILLFGLFL